MQNTPLGGGYFGQYQTEVAAAATGAPLVSGKLASSSLLVAGRLAR